MLRSDFASTAVQYLGNKFLNAEMWLHLLNTMRDQYQMRLNYALTAAYMAERALAFEIQNPLLRVVRFDYYDQRRDGHAGRDRVADRPREAAEHPIVVLPAQNSAHEDHFACADLPRRVHNLP